MSFGIMGYFLPLFFATQFTRFPWHYSTYIHICVCTSSLIVMCSVNREIWTNCQQSRALLCYNEHRSDDKRIMTLAIQCPIMGGIKFISFRFFIISFQRSPNEIEGQKGFLIMENYNISVIFQNSQFVITFVFFV